MGKENMRTVRVGVESFELEGEPPTLGGLLNYSFILPDARGPNHILTPSITEADLKKGLVIISTLPNIQKQHCLQQIKELESLTYKLLPRSTKIFHVSADDRSDWKKAEEHLASVRFHAYTLADAAEESVVSFKAAFGVGVKGTHRIAHGLFALLNGKFINLQVPDDQLGVPNVPLFLKEILDVKFA